MQSFLKIPIVSPTLIFMLFRSKAKLFMIFIQSRIIPRFVN